MSEQNQINTGIYAAVEAALNSGGDCRVPYISVTSKSPYDIAVDMGFLGTEKQWLDTLRVELGDPDLHLDMEAFKLFINGTKDVLITKRNGEEFQALNHYLEYLRAIELVFSQAEGSVTVDGTEIKTIRQTIQDALSINADIFKGDAGTIDSFTVTTSEAGSDATITLNGSASSREIELTVPRGDKGETGEAAQISGITVVTGDVGTDASISVSGSPMDRTFELTIPRGDRGEKGDTGTLENVTVITGEPETDVSVTLGGTAEARTMELTIPKGTKGDEGQAGTIAEITVVMGESNSEPKVVMGGTEVARTFELTIPKGDQGDSAGVANFTVTTLPEDAEATVEVSGPLTERNVALAIPRGATGPAGVAGGIVDVTATSGTEAGVTMGGTATERTIALTLPKGDQGLDGNSGIIESVTVNTGAAGSDAAVVVGGTPLNRTLALTIPRGDKGEKGVVENFYDITTLEAPNTYLGPDGVYKRSNDPLNAASRKVGTAAGNLVERDANGYPTNNNAIGVGQTWQDVTATRTRNVTYTNTTGKPIYVSITTPIGSSLAYLEVGGVNVAGARDSSSPTTVFSAIVPNGSTYNANLLVNFTTWAELR